MTRDCDLSVIIPFTDDEEHVGAQIRRVAAHLAALGAGFEILAVDEGSGDNSAALIALLRDRLPALRVLAAAPGRGFAAGARVARGHVLWLWDARLGGAPVGALSWAQGRLTAGADVAVVPGRYTVCRRTAAWKAVERARGRGRAFEAHLVRLAARGKLRVVVPRLRA